MEIQIKVVISKGPVAKMEKIHRIMIEIPYEPIEVGEEQIGSYLYSR